MLVLGLKWHISLKVSNFIFLASFPTIKGYSPCLHVPKIFTKWSSFFLTLISINCLFPSDLTIWPLNWIHDPIPSLHKSSKLGTSLSTIICKFLTEEPSFKSIKQKFPPPPWRRDFIHPPTFTTLSINFWASDATRAHILILPPNEVYLFGFWGAGGELLSSIFNSVIIFFNPSNWASVTNAGWFAKFSSVGLDSDI